VVCGELIVAQQLSRAIVCALFCEVDAISDLRADAGDDLVSSRFSRTAAVGEAAMSRTALGRFPSLI
jgi:hypothetical protein